MIHPCQPDVYQGLDSRAIRTGHHRTAEGEHAEPIFTTSSFVFRSAAEAAARFAGDEPGNIYGRFTNPTVQAFEQRLAALEDGEACLATASGMSAILTLCLGLLQSGDRILTSRSLFGSTTQLFDNYLSRFGIQTDYVALTDLNAWAAAIQPATRLLFVETPSNPLMQLADIRALADIAHAHNSLLVVDNCFCTPVLQQPLKLGADLVIHSATKYLDGQGRALGGAIVGPAAIVQDKLVPAMRTAGPCMSPFNAWLFLKGLETLPLRMRAHSAAAAELAHWLTQQPVVKQVNYPGLLDHPQYALAQAQQTLPGGIVSFVVKGGRAAAWQVIDQTRMISITANLGDVKTTITHPASTTHGRWTDAQRVEAGIEEGLIRIAVGLEDIADIQADLATSLHIL
ncbi:MAG: O-succinylhomoserine sulfhydrylase [Pseudomonadota bacterium]